MFLNCNVINQLSFQKHLIGKKNTDKLEKKMDEILYLPNIIIHTSTTNFAIIDLIGISFAHTKYLSVFPAFDQT